MNLSKAIEILKAGLMRPGSIDKLDFQDAEQLGIEALKRVKAYKEAHVSSHYELMPGETKD